MLKDAIVGAKWGLALSALLSTWAMVLAVIRGSLVIRDRTGEGYHVLFIVLLYLVSGVGVGALIGALRRRLQSPPQAIALGIVATLPIAVALAVGRSGFRGWTYCETISVSIMSLAFGGPGGLLLRAFERASRKRRSDRH